jgi:hypothetical protein
MAHKFKKLSDLLKSFQSIANEQSEAKNKSRLIKSQPNKDKFSNSVFDFLTLHQNWNHIVGEQLAKFTEPAKIQYSCLIIKVTHPAFAQQIDYMSEKIKEKIFTDYPQLKKLFKKIRFVSSPDIYIAPEDDFDTYVQKKEKPNLNSSLYNPLYLKLKNQVEMEFSDIEDLELKKLLVSIQMQNLSTKNRDS